MATAMKSHTASDENWRILCATAIRPTNCPAMRVSPVGWAFATLDETCQGSVPESLIAFLDADDFAHTLRLVISLGGDADTQAAIAGAVAEAFWGGVPDDIRLEVDRCLPEEMQRTIEAFHGLRDR